MGKYGNIEDFVDTRNIMMLAIANELAEANRLKRIELDRVHKVNFECKDQA